MIHKEYQRFIPHLTPTPPDIEGPFYKAGATEMPSGYMAPKGPGGDAPLDLTGNVLATDGTPIAGAILDVWQADAHGVYDNDGFNLRGKIHSDGKGTYALHTIMPGDYQIAENPPDFRCAHVHFKVSAPGFKPLTTQLYFPDDKYNATDHWFDKRRVIQHPDGKFDFVLERM